MGSLWLGRYFRIDVFIHWSFWLLPVAIALMSRDSQFELSLNVAVVFAVFGCVVLHEFGHALTARLFGVGTRDITLYPIGGVARLEQMSESAWEEFWIAVAGPAVNVAIAILLIPVIVIWAMVQPGLWNNLSAITMSFPAQFVLRLLAANIVLVIFNMLPAFPMDGGRVFRAVLVPFLGHVKATGIAASVGVVVAIAFALFGWFVLHSPMAPVVAFFVFIAGQQELLMVKARARQRAREAAPLPAWAARPPRPVTSFAPGAPVAEAVPIPLPPFTLQPHIAVYTWDDEEGAWVAEPPRPPRRPSWGQP